MIKIEAKIPLAVLIDGYKILPFQTNIVDEVPEKVARDLERCDYARIITTKTRAKAKTKGIKEK